MYQPPRFGLLHFEPSALRSGGGDAVRWLSGWQGPTGEPAQQVTLGWAYDEKVHIVVATGTVQRLPDKADRRADGVFQAFGGLQLAVPTSLSAAQVQQALDRARTVADFEPVEIVGDGQVCTGAARTVHGVLIGHVRVGVRVATFAAVGLRVDEIRLQTLESQVGYKIDPNTSQSVDDVQAHWPLFLKAR